MNDISKENFGEEKVNLHSFLYIFGFVVYIMLWALTLIHFTQGVGIYFEKLYFFVMWLILSLLSAIVIYILIPRIMKRPIWKVEGERLEYVVSAFAGFNLVPIILMLNSFTLGDYHIDEYEINKVKIYTYKRTAGLIISAHNENSKLKFYIDRKKIRDIIDVSELSKIEKLSKLSLDSLTLIQERELVSLSRTLTIESRLSMLGLSNVNHVNCNY